MLIMASGRKHTRFTIDVSLPSEEAKTGFKNRLASVTDLLSPLGGPKLDKLGLMTALFDLVEAARPNTGAHSSASVAPSGGFLPFSGIYINAVKYNRAIWLCDSGLCPRDSDPSDQGMFIIEQGAFKHLCERLVEPCSCHFSGAPWKLDKSMQVLPHTVTYIYMLQVPNTMASLSLYTERACSACYFSVWTLPKVTGVG